MKKKLVRKLTDTVELLSLLGLPYMEPQRVIADLMEGNYDVFLEDTYDALPEDSEVKTQVEKLLGNL